ncbi:bifunctional tetrahydrofolate synthase/dihydrofolate synthase [soil metagenome]
MEQSAIRNLDDFRRYQEALARTFQLIEQSDVHSESRDEFQALARDRQNRVEALLDHFGAPHRTLPIVHVAGTSGKGSTATALASMLTAGKYRTGLHVSPYLQAATEKIQIDGKLIAGPDFADLVDLVLETAAGHQQFRRVPISYAEAWLVMTLVWFSQQNVDIVVLETGAGGRFDMTNVVNPLLSVITPIGLDHAETLGPTIEAIAWHKAGIIKPGVPVVTSVNDAAALAIIEAEATKHGVDVIRVPGSDAIRRHVSEPDQATFQDSNLALATRAVEELDWLGFTVTESQRRSGLNQYRIPGRAERMPTMRNVLLDGAHNPQKMKALSDSLHHLARVRGDGRRTVVFGALQTKNVKEMLALLVPMADQFIFTEPSVFGKIPCDPAELLATADSLGFSGSSIIVSGPVDALIAGLEAEEDDSSVVVTGSMYLVGNVRDLWYPTDQIVVQRTSWPATD